MPVASTYARIPLIAQFLIEVVLEGRVGGGMSVLGRLSHPRSLLQSEGCRYEDVQGRVQEDRRDENQCEPEPVGRVGVHGRGYGARPLRSTPQTKHLSVVT
jgi:hypothetical protein